jgi:chorismate dehydratase
MTIDTATDIIRLGVFDYLNVAPVYHWLDTTRPDTAGARLQKVSGVPSALNAALLTGSVDVANVSSMAFATHVDDLVLLPHLSIAAREQVKSVMLFSWHDDWRALDGKRIALTDHSATSVALVRLLAQQRYGIRPEFVTMPSDLDAMLATSDAALIIGNDAFREYATRRIVAGRSQPYIFDLATEWYDWTGLPFVFGVWAARAERADAIRRADVLTTLLRAKNEGLTRIDEIAAAESAQWHLPPTIIADYLHTLRYDLREEDQDGLRQFLAMTLPALDWRSIQWL